MSLTTDQIPHVVSLASLRAVVQGVQREVVIRKKMAQNLDCPVASVGKRLDAARVLGWIGGKARLPLVTPEGSRLLTESPGSAGERARCGAARLSCRVQGSRKGEGRGLGWG